MIDYFNFAESKSELKDRGSISSKAVMSTVTAVDQSPRKGPQAKERTRRMPWCLRPKKDAETGETFMGSCIQAMSHENPNGATHPE